MDKNPTVAALGPAGTYSHRALLQQFPNGTPLFCRTLDEVVASVAEKKADYAVLPVENSTNGVVVASVNALIQSQLKRKSIAVVGEQRVHVKHQLYSKSRSLSSIKVVYSHPQVWEQTSVFLKTKLPNAKLINVDSTASAVRQVLTSGTEEEAAIGAPGAGNGFSTLPPLVNNCCNHEFNTTRFLVLKASNPNLQTSGQRLRAHAVVPESTPAETVQAVYNHKVYFVAAVPANIDWKYNVYIEFAVRSTAEVPDGWLTCGLNIG